MRRHMKGKPPMSKKPLRIACLVLLTILCLVPFPGARAFLAKPENHSVAANYQASTTTVEVTFDGLMVFRKVSDHYEVGVLDGTITRGHEFKITVDNEEKKIERVSSKDPKDKGPKKWSLHVLTAAGTLKPV